VPESPVRLLGGKFREREAFRPGKGGYRLLPFRFTALDAERYVATNAAGQHIVLPKETVGRLIAHDLSHTDPSWPNLEGRLFAVPDDARSVALAIDLLATQQRTRFSTLADFTSLHMLVVTLRCDTACKYCQVSHVGKDTPDHDMSEETADRAIDLVFRSPSPSIKIEFQGGEPLLVFPTIRRAVLRAKAINETERRELAFVVATNLAPLTDEMLSFFGEHGVMLSTSLDGPRHLHNANRPHTSGDAYLLTVAGIRRVRQTLGQHAVSALMTTSRASLDLPEAIIDEYVAQRFDSVFLRPISPFGYATVAAERVDYSASEWNDFYERALRYIIHLNRSGVPFREDFTALLVRRLLTPFATGYVDLQSPAGLGIAAAAYDFDGSVYMSDEGRMLGRTGDTTFRLGDVRDSYESLFYSQRLYDVLDATMTEATPQCSDCAFEPACGTDPTLHQATQKDMVGHRPTSRFCARHMHAFRLIIRMLEDEPQAREVLLQWAS